MRYLTKSRFKLALDCPTKLDYCDDRAYADANDDNEFLRALADGGHQVGALAKCLFPAGTEIDVAGHDAQVELTTRLMQQENVALFEAAFRLGNEFIRVDLLEKCGNVLRLYEVKAKGYDPRKGEDEILGARGGIKATYRAELYDVAFQRHLLRRLFPGMELHCHLVMPDKSRAIADDRVGQRLRIRRDRKRVQIVVDPSLHDGRITRELLHVLPVDRYLDILEQQPMQFGGYELAFADGIALLGQVIAGEEALAARPGAQCRKCQFRATPEQRAQGQLDGRRQCWKTALKLSDADIDAGTVFNLYGRGDITPLVDARNVRLADLEPEDVKLDRKDNELTNSHRRWLQCEEARQAVEDPFVMREPLRDALADLRYPLHFIDFETAMPAIPFHGGRHAYEQLLYQFSHHRADEDGRIVHASEFLCDAEGVFPNFETVRALARAIGHDGGSVIHWWTHEKTVLNAVRRQLQAATDQDVPDRGQLLAFLADLLDGGRLVDLGQHIVARTVFLPGTAGSSSIKKVLPALLALVPELQRIYGEPVYGGPAMPSLNFRDHAWVRHDTDGRVIDPYQQLGHRFADPDLQSVPEGDDGGETTVNNGGAAAVAYCLLQTDLPTAQERAELRRQMLRYCELDTLAMVMAWQGLHALLARA